MPRHLTRRVAELLPILHNTVSKSDEIRDFCRDGDKRAFFGPTPASPAVAPSEDRTVWRRSFAYRLGRGQIHLVRACHKVRCASSPAHTACALPPRPHFSMVALLCLPTGRISHGFNRNFVLVLADWTGRLHFRVSGDESRASPCPTPRLTWLRGPHLHSA